MNDLSNGLIAQLGLSDQALVLRHAVKISLKAGDVLCGGSGKNSKIYFPLSGSIAIYIHGKSKDPSSGLALGLIGAEGAVGLQAALGLSARQMQFVVQSPGQALLVEGAFAERLVKRRRVVLLQFTHYLWTLFESIADLVSRRFTQDIKLRLAYWLLLSAQRCAPDPLRLTHAQIAKMLGVRRASISIAARDIKLKRYIGYSRGNITLLYIAALETLAMANSTF
jgi:CRP-like cAMP-binding protein